MMIWNICSVHHDVIHTSDSYMYKYMCILRSASLRRSVYCLLEIFNDSNKIELVNQAYVQAPIRHKRNIIHHGYYTTADLEEIAY